MKNSMDSLAVLRSVEALILRYVEVTSVYLQLTVKKNPFKGPSLSYTQRLASPIIVKLPHRAREKKLTQLKICLVVKDPTQKYFRALEEDKKAVTHGLFSDILSITKLKKRLASNEFDIKDFDLIVVQQNVAHLLPDVIDPKLFRSSKTTPVPIHIANEIDPRLVSYQVKKIVNKSAVLSIPPEGSTCMSILIGNTAMGVTKLAENVLAAVDGLIGTADMIGDWENISGVHIKTADSASLPLWKPSQV